MPPGGEGNSSAGPLSSKVACDPLRPHRKDCASFPAEVESARTERRIGKCWEATRAPTQWPRPIQGDAAPSPFHLSAGTEPASGEAPKRKILGSGGKAPAPQPASAPQAGVLS